MATRKFVFGKPPFRFLVDHISQDEEFQHDLKQIVDLDDEAYQRLATQLAKSDAFMSRSELGAIVGESVSGSADQIANLIYRIAGIVHDSEIDATDAMDALAKAIEEKSQNLDVHDRKKLTSRLRKLAAEPIGIAKQFKARELVDAIGADKGRVVLQNAQRTDRSTDPQFVASSEGLESYVTSSLAELKADELLRELADAGQNPPTRLLCAVELIRFDGSQQEVLLPLLWRYILAHRDSNNRDELIATGAAIRKYMAIIPMTRIGELAVLLESGHRSTLPIDLEIEVAKMVFRNFEVYPPVANDTQPKLAQRLWEIVEAYVNPRILLRDKHSAIASLAIEAIVAMRSSYAIEAWHAAAQCPYRWFAELVNDDLEDLHEKWSRKSPEAAAWLGKLRSQVLMPT